MAIFDELAKFISQEMRMSHIYQPLMLKALLMNSGRCHERQIAERLLAYDDSQIEYYIHITNNMVGRVLRSHNIVVRDKATKEYSLVGFQELSSEQIQILVELCRKRLDDFLEARGDSIFNHRRKSSGYISGTIKYEVLKRAGFHCELCGISADEKALEVDHIVPRNKGGSDDLSNFQALCYSCNAMKRDNDDTDFRAVRESYKRKETGCIFCGMKKIRVLAENELAYAALDGFPVSENHTLIVPKRHVSSYFDLGQAEINASHSLINWANERIKEQDRSVDGMNVGINCGESAGQTIFHCHIHLIPRRKGDVPNPRGGVRHVIPSKGDYLSV